MWWFRLRLFACGGVAGLFGSQAFVNLVLRGSTDLGLTQLVCALYAVMFVVLQVATKRCDASSDALIKTMEDYINVLENRVRQLESFRLN